MKTCRPVLALLALATLTAASRAEMPVNVRCAIDAQKVAQNMGRQYKRVYDRRFELCMIAAMPSELRAEYESAKQKTEEARTYATATAEGEHAAAPIRPARGRWVRESANVWVLK